MKSVDYRLKKPQVTLLPPQFLGEAGKKGITIENFQRLLISCGLNWDDFEMYYKGDSTNKFIQIHNDITAEQHIPYQSLVYKELKKRITPYPYQKQIGLNLLKIIEHRSILKGDEPEIKQFIHYLETMPETLYLSFLEFDFAVFTLDFMPYELVERLKHYFYHMLENAPNYSFTQKFYIAILHTIRYLTKNEYYTI